MANFSLSFHMKSLALVLCIGVLLQGRITFAQNSSSGQEAVPAKSDAQLIRRLEEPGGYVDRLSHDRSA